MSNCIEQICRQIDEKSGISDLFLCVGKIPAVRHNGIIEELDEQGPLQEAAALEFLDHCCPPGTVERLTSECDLDLAAVLPDSDMRFRVNLSRQQGRLSFAIRRIPSGRLDNEKLGIPEWLLKLSMAKQGLLLVTGPSGSGKSTTLACLVNYLNDHARKNILTLEDPIEFIHKENQCLISQREIGNDTKNFATALRHAVRQNPDVILIGEMRDQDTVTTAVNAAMTGHFVLATMHTKDNIQTLERILAFYPEELRSQIALDLSRVVVGIISQRLVMRADGSRRVPVFEILENTPVAQRLIAKQEYVGLSELLKCSTQHPMISQTRYLYQLYQAGTVSLEDARLAAQSPEEFQMLSQGLVSGVDTFRFYSADPDSGLSIKTLLNETLRQKASDLLLTCGSAPVIRIDGELYPLKDMPVLTPSDTRKLLYSILNSRQRADFEETRELDLALGIRNIGDTPEEQSAERRFRVNVFFQKGAVAAAIRVIASALPPLESLGIPIAVLQMTMRHQGLVLVTGPTGSGKSTTLAALINLINQHRACHIITVEDPIEFVHEHGKALIEQREVKEDTLSFANALKYVLRQDPDVILVGEMRDLETISTAMTAAETGHLVFATLHTNDVTQTVDRIVDVFPADRQNQIRTQLASCLEAVISQRLLPLNSPRGGRIAAFEVMVATAAIRALIREKRTFQIQGMMETSAKDGMITMERALQNLLQAGKITRETYDIMVPRGTLPAKMPLR